MRAFQKANSLTVDGTAGQQTLSVLYSEQAIAAPEATATPKATATPAPDSGTASSTLRKGDKGDSVKSLQSRLIELGYLTGKADGVYGTKTYEAVIAFQQANKLSADGVAGAKTQTKLNSSSAVPTGSGATPAPTATPVPTAPPVTTKPKASQVIYANWYTKIKAVAKK